jgi:hypothetical protein
MTQPEIENKPIPQKPVSNSSNWVFGLAVIVIGGLLLARNLGLELFFLDFHNWWAFIILFAAINPLLNAWQGYKTGGFNNTVINSLVSAGTIIFIALIFLLDLSLGVWWPSFIIIGGLYMITSGRQ